jgi:acetyltransferase-like isoleucine patch superfamily enzyme
MYLNICRRLARFAAEPLIENTERISHWYWLLKTQFYHRIFFRQIGARSRIIRPVRLRNVEHISIGDEVAVHQQCWPQTFPRSNPPPEVIIDRDCVIGNFNHITCVDRVPLEEKVLTADGVVIIDHGQRYDDPQVPIVAQGVVTRGPVSIGKGTWIGEHAVVMSCRIGQNCVFGANAVMVPDIPDFSVAADVPAKIIRAYGTESTSGNESETSLSLRWAP